MVSCLVPSARVTEPSLLLSMPAGALAPSAGTTGQVVAQEPEQLDFDGSGVSLSKR